MLYKAGAPPRYKRNIYFIGVLYGAIKSLKLISSEPSKSSWLNR
ncbi:hypothetical protein HCH_01164 [Hahella chejuensis KCTC 2396]|uniref:Uncharacterized protein n=1 Tax=Hahella chejuensis (strain KCTC 2396) TaxID=349521 RepID=Q2SMT3_HAHCH|nr:hypothetical protein HCH_01164 [Hahella chejuensis KCTC 2396]